MLRRPLLHLQRWTLLYAVVVVMMALSYKALFPGNRFLTTPWHHDDYDNLSACYFRGAMPLMLLSCRPVSSNIIFVMGARGETTYALSMLALAAAIPVLSLRLAQRLFNLRAPPGLLTLIQVGAVAVATFAFEHALQYYRYTGMMTSLVSATTAFIAATLLADYLDGSRGPVLGLLFGLLSAFAKEDCFGFVLVFVVLYANLHRNEARTPGLRRRLLYASGGLIAIGLGLYVWNRYIVHSVFTMSASADYQPQFAPAWIASQIYRYITVSYVSKMIFGVYLAMLVVTLTRKSTRAAAVSTILLLLALLGPYTLLPRFFEFYSLNWLSLAFAFAIVGLHAAARAWWPLPGRCPLWIAGACTLACTVLLLVNPASQQLRAATTQWLNTTQQANQYMLMQVVAHQSEFANSAQVVVRGVDDVISPWTNSHGGYVNLQLNRSIRWLVVARPGSMAANLMARYPAPGKGEVTLVFEEDLAQFPPAPVLRFDSNLNLLVERSSR